MEHTKEPWKVCEPTETLHAIRSESNRVVADVGYSDTDGQNRANARRIVACVNGCAGVTTEELETGGFVAGLIEQRDELEKLCNYHEKIHADMLERLAEAPRWRDVAEELPQEAQEVLFVRGGKVVHGAWIGGIFWHSNQKMAAATWMPLPKPPKVGAGTTAEPDCDRSACGDFSPGRCDNPECPALRHNAQLQNEVKKLTIQRDELLAAVEKLARLGNEPHYGNSIGNQIARDALAKVGAGDTAVQGDMLLPANAKVTGSRRVA